jgi:hypothetical protein
MKKLTHKSLFAAATLLSSVAALADYNGSLPLI